MEALKARIQEEGRILPGNIVKVDGFLNHQVDPQLLGQIADEFARLFDIGRVTKILTAEASGISLAAVCAYRYGLPMSLPRRPKATTSKVACTKAKSFPILTSEKSRCWWQRIGSPPGTGCSL